ncbi:RDD family protein [Mycolicibacterium rufum]|uniref:RDD family protein n=1 Tax=Mycolicibacterium rufum TaxID=318424 RepID=A0A9X3BNV5_9MYCO|nr:RDD family protein [Mycolicibacterium rufum]KGI68805.1 transporter [Mycolicibacterium rufum]MCV7070812.1 RDD family protein [Mycolicibacterium rufum]ULP34953.1 RDD family protein [Mycolicibacterium rufum]
MSRTSGSGLGSWLSGPGTPEPGTYPGERLGLPRSGSGSIARFGRRIAALAVDWVISLGLAALATTLGLISLPVQTTQLIVWFLLGVVSVRLFGFSPGQFALGLKVVSVDGRGYVGAGRALARGLLIALVIPALFTDSDLRGLHDLATKTAVVKR